MEILMGLRTNDELIETIEAFEVELKENNLTDTQKAKYKYSYNWIIDEFDKRNVAHKYTKI